MRHANFRAGVDSAAAAAQLAMGLVLASSGCGLEQAPDPDLAGPSDTGVSVELSAAPDVVNADGVSPSVIRLVLRGKTGEPLSGRPVLFQHDGDGLIAPSAGSSFVGPVQTGLVMLTDSRGEASIVYVAGNQIRPVTVWVRPYGIDTTFTWERSVEILQR
jgi:hypothetical protein